MAIVRPLAALCVIATSLAAQAGTLVRVEVRDADGTPVPGAIVFLEGGAPAAPSPGARAVIDQRDKIFVPEVTVIQTGTEVAFPNSDTVSHHVYSFARPNAFELPLYKGGSRPNVRFDHPGIVTLGCNIHDAMIGYVVVVDTPWFARADDSGVTLLDDVPDGTYAVRVWSQRLDPARPFSSGSVVVRAGPVERQVSVGRRMRPGPGQRGAIAAGDY
jgi:plastocyanin